MDLVVTLVLGVLVGWLAGVAVGGSAPGSRMANALLGIVGSVLGDWAAGVLGLASEGTPARWFVAGVGALLLVALARGVASRRPAGHA